MQVNTLITEHFSALWGIPLTLLCNALLVAAEFGLIKIRFSHFNRDLRDRVESHNWVGGLYNSGDRTIQVIRLGLGACLLLYALFAYPLCRDLLTLSGISGVWAELAAPLVAFFLALIVHQLVGELFPRGLGLAYPFQVLRIAAPVILVLGWLSRPLRGIVYTSGGLVWRLWQKAPLPDLDALDLDAQIELLRKESPEMSAVAQLILKNTLQLRDLVVSDVLLPRNQVKFFDLNLSLNENLKLARESGHTRFPLCYGDLDRCLGLIHIKDIFRYEGNPERLDLRRIKRNMIRIDSEEPLETALTKLLSHRVHMALVIDEFRGTEGVLTLERILEQLVGAIRDEFDADEEVLVRADRFGEEAVVSGLTPLHEIEAIFGIELETDEVSTIGGLITSELGRIPESGENLESGGLAIEITDVDETRVLEVRLRLLGENEDSDLIE
jgi:CBS domain containing-hemolysin-like protein